MPDEWPVWAHIMIGMALFLGRWGRTMRSGGGDVVFARAANWKAQSRLIPERDDRNTPFFGWLGFGRWQRDLLGELEANSGTLLLPSLFSLTQLFDDEGWQHDNPR